jgi:hypothetical protein
MRVFSSKNHDTSTYVHNTAMWLHDLRGQLSGRAIHKGGMMLDRPEDGGGILITPRHLLYCAHFYPHAANTWGANLNDSRPATIRFLLANNTVVEAVQIHQQPVTTSEGGYIDLVVATLDRDVAELGVHVMPICPYDRRFFDTVLRAGAPSLPVFSVSQGYESTTSQQPWSQPVSDYPYPDHDVLCYIIDWHNKRQNASNPAIEPLTYQHFNFAVYQGDSGSPSFFILGGTIYLHMILTHVWSGPFVADYINEINNAIAQADAKAISLGRLDSPTGLTVSMAPQPTL